MSASSQVPAPIPEAVRHLKRLPGIGEKTATRLIYWLLRQESTVISDLSLALAGLTEGVRECATCCDFCATELCALCSNPRREDQVICVVEQPQDIVAFERSGEYRGRYHVLHGAISPLDGISPDALRIKSLLARIAEADTPIEEVILATNANVEGDATALYLGRLLQPLEIRTTRLAHGISVGTEIEYADAVSLARALQNRREL